MSRRTVKRVFGPTAIADWNEVVEKKQRQKSNKIKKIQVRKKMGEQVGEHTWAS
jgi:hypothetical protein